MVAVDDVREQEGVGKGVWEPSPQLRRLQVVEPGVRRLV